MGILAWLVFEVSKNCAEADADICETIDFCEFYAREALRLANVEAPVQCRVSAILCSISHWVWVRSFRHGIFLRHHGRDDAGFDRLRKYGDFKTFE